MSAYATIRTKLASGRIVILDGGTGTELERRGAAMDGGAWCALATETRPDVLRNVHDAYIAAGADIVTANTFSTLPHLLARSGAADRAEALLRESVRIAREAVAASGRPVAVAGSISTTRMPKADGSRPGLAEEWSLADALRDLPRVAAILAESGCDLLLLEMIADLDYGGAAFRAARTTGLPVWVGVSARTAADGSLTTFDEGGGPLEPLVAGIAAWQPDGIGIMHTAIPDMAPALDILRRHWTGPTMAYPEAGWFEMPSWNFVEIDPAGLVAQAQGWRTQGATILGGCCGLGPEHVAALAKAFA